MDTFGVAAARVLRVAAFFSLVIVLSACGEGEGPDRQRPEVSFSEVEELRTEAALRFISTDDALAELESAVAELDSAGQVAALSYLESLRGTRASLQARLDSMDAPQLASGAAFDSLRTQIRSRIDGLDASIARDRFLIVADAGQLRALASGRLERLSARATALRADSTLESVREAAVLDSARVKLERQVALLGDRNVRFDSLRDVLASGFGELRRLDSDTLTRRLRADSLR